MRFLTRCLAAVVALVLIVATPHSFAQNRTARSDPRLTRALQSQRLAFTSRDNGVVSTRVNRTGSERRHEVMLESATNTFDGLEVRQVWAYACRLDREISIDLASRLLSENGRMPLGSWELLKMDDASTVIFTAKVPAGLGARPLRTVIALVADTADALEEELTQRDQY